MNITASVFMLEYKQRQFWNPWEIPYKCTLRFLNFLFRFLST